MVEGIGGAPLGLPSGSQDNTVAETKQSLINAHSELSPMAQLLPTEHIGFDEPAVKDVDLQVDKAACFDALDEADAKIKGSGHANEPDISRSIQDARAELTNDNGMAAAKHIRDAIELL